MGQLDGRTALVTGGNSGIGLATAKRLADEGAYVFITGRDRKRLDEAAAKIGAHGVQSDISKPEELDALAAEIAERGKGLDVLFANAGGGDFATLAEVTPQHYRDNFDRNVAGTVFTVQKALPLLNAGASVVLAGSTALQGHPGVRPLRRVQGRHPIPGPHLGRRVGRPQDPGEHHHSRSDRNPRTHRPGTRG